MMKYECVVCETPAPHALTECECGVGARPVSLVLQATRVYKLSATRNREALSRLAE